MTISFYGVATLAGVLLSAVGALAQSSDVDQRTGADALQFPTNRANDNPPANVLSADEWRRVDAAVQRGLEWLADQQRPDGSFPTQPTGQPAVTCLSMMAFISHGHMPGRGRFGKRLERATDYVIACQKPSGLVALVGPDGPEISRYVSHEIGTCAAYNHAISSLTLSEVYGMSSGPRAQRIQIAINKSLAATLLMQRWPKDRAADRGGWRYIGDTGTDAQYDSDLSITGWELMFLRSAQRRLQCSQTADRRCRRLRSPMLFATIRRFSIRR